VGIREIAESDLSVLIESQSDFGWPVSVTSPAGVTESVTALSNDISLVIDPETGMPVTGRNATATFRTSSLLALAFPMPTGIEDTKGKPFLVTFNDIAGNSIIYKIKTARPDRTIGCVVCVLEFWKVS